MNEEELKAKADELEAKAKELEEREEALKASEAEIADASQIVANAKIDFEKSLEDQKNAYEKRLSDRDKIIKDLMMGKEEKPSLSIVDEINARRERQRKGW